jgi:DNA polymerase
LAESADLPLFRVGAARALPHGPAGAELMLLTGIPAPEDAAEGKPLGGSAALLAERMLRAVGLAADQAYVAALACFSGTGTRFSDADSAACRDTILAQIALAAPKRLLLLGDQPAKLLLGQPMATARGKLHRIAGVPTAVTFPPRHLLGNNAHKALAWADLQLIMGE